MIEARNVRLCIGSRVLFERLEFDVKQGEFVAVLGPNGCGKTTLLRAIAGLVEITTGGVAVDGRDISRLSATERAQRIALIAADEMTAELLPVRDVVATGRYPYHRWWDWRDHKEDDDAVTKALRAVSLESFARRDITTLSSGERQRAWLAMALAQQTPVLLLDEPTSHLDLRAAHEILDLLRSLRAEKTIMSVLHDPNEAFEYADRFLLLGFNEMTMCKNAEEVVECGWFERVLGVRVETLRAANGRLRVFPRTEFSTAHES